MISYPSAWSSLRIALCHDWLTGMRGGERVLEWLCRGFPQAPILTLIHQPQAVSDTINAHPVHTSWLQRVPGIARRYRLALPLMPAAAAGLRAPPSEALISLSHCVAKAMRPAPGARHLCYCFTPMRYAWTFHEEYFGRHPLKRAALAPMLAALRAWDRRSAARVDRFVAISEHVRTRIRTFYSREADVVYPPVDTEAFTPGPSPAGPAYDLLVSALVPYKRIDLAVQTYSERGWPLRVVGSGTQAAALRRRSGPSVQWLGRVGDEALLELYRGCRLLVFPGEEDFGIVPLEAMACGRPVVAYGRGGAAETVADGRTGVLFDRQTTADLAGAVEAAARRTWDPALLRAHAERFGPQQFLDGLNDSLHALLSEPADAPSPPSGNAHGRRSP